MFGDRVQQALSCGPATSDGDETITLGRMAGDGIIKSVDVFASASVATQGTNYITLSLINLGTDGTGTTVIATASTSQTGGSAIPANKAFPLTITAAQASVLDGVAIGFKRAEQNTNASTIAHCRCVVRYLPVGSTST